MQPIGTGADDDHRVAQSDLPLFLRVQAGRNRFGDGRGGRINARRHLLDRAQRDGGRGDGDLLGEAARPGLGDFAIILAQLVAPLAAEVTACRNRPAGPR